jgi:hypothetical protein
MTVAISDIESFMTKVRSENDEMNKLRELIITKIISNTIPEEFYEPNIYSNRWCELKDAVKLFLNETCDSDVIEVIPRGGRKYNYDITVRTSTTTYNLEFKYNASKVEDTPQFVSPMNPSQYLQSSFESYYYNNYLGELCKLANQEKPDYETYSKQVGGNRPECVSSLQDLYYQGCSKSSKYTGKEKAVLFYSYANMLSKDSIKKFIQENDLDIIKLTKYLQDTQKDKIYMMYKDGKFYKEEVDIDNYNIIYCTKDPLRYRYICETKTGLKLTILLRWKNGNGIAFPAFQISGKKNVNKNSIQTPIDVELQLNSTVLDDVPSDDVPSDDVPSDINLLNIY